VITPSHLRKFVCTWYPRPSTMCAALTHVWVLTLKMLARLESSPPVTSTLPSTSREMPAVAYSALLLSVTGFLASHCIYCRPV